MLLIFKNELIYKIKHRDIGFTLLNAHYNNSQQITIFAPLKTLGRYMNKKVAFYTLGCKLNFSETSTIARGFEKEEFERVDFSEEADVYVINTCSVTENADKRFLPQWMGWIWCWVLRKSSKSPII